MKPKTKKIKTVINKYDLNGQYICSYETCVEAGKKNFIYPRVIEKCSRGELKSAGGFQWRRVRANAKIKNIRKLKSDTINKYLPIEVNQYSLDGEFIKKHPSIKRAALEIGIDSKNIREVLKGKQKTAGGYIWKKANSK